MKTLLLLAYNFPPIGWSGVQRTLKFVKFLPKMGWKPLVITVENPSYRCIDQMTDKSLEKEIPKEVEVIRIYEKKVKDQTDVFAKSLLKDLYGEDLDFLALFDGSLIKELQDRLLQNMRRFRQDLLKPDPNVVWSYQSYLKACELIETRRIDAIMSTSSPYSAHLAALKLKKDYFLPWLVDLRDAWTFNPLFKKDPQSFEMRMHYIQEKNVLQNADHIVVVTKQTREIYRSKFPFVKDKISVLTNGYDEEDFQVHPIVNSEYFTILHNGTIYPQSFSYLQRFFNALRSLVEKDRIFSSAFRFLCVGRLSEQVEGFLQSFFQKQGLSKNLKVLPYCEHGKSLSYLMGSDLLLLLTAQGESMKSWIPGKTFEYLRSQKPLIALVPEGSCVEEILRKTKRGKACQNEKNIEELISKTFYLWKKKKETKKGDIKQIQQYERRVLTAHLVDLLERSVEKCLKPKRECKL